jgi:hypothetical protein
MSVTAETPTVDSHAQAQVCAAQARARVCE